MQNSVAELTKAFSSVDPKTKSLLIMDEQVIQEESMKNLELLANEIPMLQTLIRYKDLFTLLPNSEMVISLQSLSQQKENNYQNIGNGGHGKVFLGTDLHEDSNFALKIIQKCNNTQLEYYIQECINQYHLVQINQNYILNIRAKVYLRIVNQQSSLYMPLELAEYSLYDYIKNNTITSNIFQYFYNFLIELLLILHSNNYAHRDIKPQNILFVKGKGWKLADFGESIQYVERIGMYKIQGTFAFLPKELRRQINKNTLVLQNLYTNDLYAVVCTLALIRNPQFTSRELVEYMDKQILDQQLQDLLQNGSQNYSLEQLFGLKISKIQINLNLFPHDQNKKNQQIYFDIEKNLTFNYQISKSLNQNCINFIDKELNKRQKDLNQDSFQKLQMYLILLHPFQIHLFESLKQVNLNHQYILEQPQLFFDDLVITNIFMMNFLFDNLTTYTFNQGVKQQSKDCFIYVIHNCIRGGNFAEAKEVLEVLSNMIVNDSNFDSYQFVWFNILHLQLHGVTPSLSENFIQSGCLNTYSLTSQEKYRKSFDLEQYLIQQKVVNNRVDFLKLFSPLIYQVRIEQDDAIYQHIVEILGLTEIMIINDKFLLANTIKEQLMNGGSFRVLDFFGQIVFGILKLFFQYDLFEGLIDILNYFLNFLQHRKIQDYLYVSSILLRLILKLNFQKTYQSIEIYNHRKPQLDLFNKMYLQSKWRTSIYVQNLLQINSVELLQVLVQQQKCQYSSPINLNKYQQELLDLLTTLHQLKFSIDISICLRQYVHILYLVQSDQQIYLKLVITIICNYLKNASEIYEGKLKYDQILLKYYISCKQFNRIIEIFTRQKTIEFTKSNFNEIADSLAEIVLTNQKSLKRIVAKFQFIYAQQLIKFAQNPKYRYYYDFNNHLFAQVKFKSCRKHINLHNIILKEQYLRV